MGWLSSCPKIFMGLALVHFQKYWLLSKFSKKLLNCCSKVLLLKHNACTMKPQVDLFSFVFWRKLKTPKNLFEIIWLLTRCKIWIDWRAQIKRIVDSAQMTRLMTNLPIFLDKTAESRQVASSWPRPRCKSSPRTSKQIQHFLFR